MSERFVYRRGGNVKRRVVHLAAYNRIGEYAGVLCGSTYPLDTSCNLPLGLRQCKNCLKAYRTQTHSEDKGR